MKNKVLVLVVILSLLTCSGSLAAKERRGAELKILKKDRTVLKGELIAVKPASLLLMDSQSGRDLSVDIDDIITITIAKKSKALPGLGIGLGAGILAACLIGAAIHDPNAGWVDPALGALWAVPIGTLGGLFIGALKGEDQILDIVGKSPEEIKAVLEKLRSKARIIDFQ
jgi:hypothetical protein